MTGVLLSADVYRNFVKLSHETFNLNPLYFVSISSYNYACAVYKTKLRIEFLEGPDLFTRTESTRRGVSGVFEPRFLKKIGKRSVLYLDANNLYGRSMIQALQYVLHEYAIVSLEVIIKIDCDSEVGS